MMGNENPKLHLVMVIVTVLESKSRWYFTTNAYAQSLRRLREGICFAAVCEQTKDSKDRQARHVKPPPPLVLLDAGL